MNACMFDPADPYEDTVAVADEPYPHDAPTVPNLLAADPSTEDLEPELADEGGDDA